MGTAVEVTKESMDGHLDSVKDDIMKKQGVITNMTNDRDEQKRCTYCTHPTQVGYGKEDCDLVVRTL